MTLATWITLARLLCTVPILLLLTLPGGMFTAAIVFAVVAATDWLDGFVARRFNQVSTLGKFLDPLADKILVMAVLVMLAVQGAIDVMSVLVLMIREFVIMGVRTVAAEQGVVIAARWSAKVKTALQMVAIPLIMVQWPAQPLFLNMTLGYVLYYASVVMAIVSMVEYLRDHRDVLK